MTKPQLRTQILALRAALPPSERLRAEEAVLDTLRGHPILAGAERIAVYLSFGDELSTVRLVDAWLAEGRQLGAPRIRGGRLEIAPFSSREGLVRGQLGIREPTALLWETFAAAVVPGLAFTQGGERMGYGKGHYDRLLAAHPECYTVGIGFRCQLVDALPTEAHDVRLAEVVVF